MVDHLVYAVYIKPDQIDTGILFTLSRMRGDRTVILEEMSNCSRVC
jgi:hypothetical protein